MKIAILGGSFNPIHTGHLCLADAVISNLGYDRVILVPANRSPFKPETEGAFPKDRVDMISASIAGDPHLTIDDCELKREGVSYTIDTLTEIIKRYRPDGKPGLILGDDLVADFSQWKNADALAEESDLIVAGRLNVKTEFKRETFPYRFKELNNELINVSSSQIREKIAGGGDWHYLVPQGARTVIEERKLYGLKKSSIENVESFFGKIITLENTARESLSTSRFLHSRSVALMAYDLCLHYGIDPKAGYLAGIAHDLCKTLKDEELTGLVKSMNMEISALERRKPGLLHGKAAAVLLKTKYGITDNKILQAVSSHVTCSKDMGDLAKIIYIADKLEISREYVSSNLRDMLWKTDLDGLFRATLEETVKYLKSREKEVSFNALKLLLSVRKRKKNDKKNKN